MLSALTSTLIPFEDELSPPVICSPKGSDFSGSLMVCAELLSTLEATERRDLRRLLGRLRESLVARAAHASHRAAVARNRPRKDSREKR